MAYVSIAASATDADSPIDQDLMDKIRTNLDDLNSRLGFQEALSDQSIRDDFTCSAFDADTWDVAESTPGARALLDGAPDHYVHFNTGAGGQYGVISATTKRMRIDLSRNHSVVAELRFGKATSSGDQDILVGFQDAALAGDAANNSDVSDMIGFVRGTNANTIKFRAAKAGVSAETDNLSNWTNWMKLKIEITSLSSGADITVRAYVDDVEIAGSPFTDETKIPDIMLKPWIGQDDGGGARNSALDYALYYWSARPLSA